MYVCFLMLFFISWHGRRGLCQFLIKHAVTVTPRVWRQVMEIILGSSKHSSMTTRLFYFCVFLVLPLLYQSLPCLPLLIISTIPASVATQTGFNCPPHSVGLSFVKYSNLCSITIKSRLKHLLAIESLLCNNLPLRFFFSHDVYIHKSNS